MNSHPHQRSRSVGHGRARPPRSAITRQLLLRATLAASITVALVSSAGAQSLHGSRASIERMYHRARSARLSFFRTARAIRRAATAGTLVRLDPDATFELFDVSHPFVQPPTLTFVHRLAAEYMDECGQRLVVTSAVRPASEQPANSTAHSVHPTGMAVDLRKPHAPACRRWLRSTLLELEDAHVLEATEEFSPPHFHVAVFPTAYTRYVAQRLARAASASDESTSTSTSVSPSTSRSNVGTYTVRRGDTLWDIARAHDTTVEAIVHANRLRTRTIQPGQTLEIPQGAED